MKRLTRESLFLRLDNALRWTGIPARVADQMSDAPSSHRRHRPLRWIPIWPIAFSCALFILSLTRQSALYLVSLNNVIFALLPVMVMNGPLGRPSYEDDEREAAPRKESFLFCFGLLAGLNCLGQPILMMLSHWQNWPFMRCVGVATSVLMLNATLFGAVPTLYASWSMRPLPIE
jgi:hypothetical protein